MRTLNVWAYWTGGIAVALFALLHTNLMPVILGVLWLMLVIFGIGLYDTFPQLELSLGRFARDVKLWGLLRLPFAAFVASSFVFAPTPTGEHHVVDKGNGKVIYRTGFSMASFNPLTTSVRSYSYDQTIGPLGFSRTKPVTCEAKTADGAGVRARISSELVLPQEGLRAAHLAAGSQSELRMLVRKELCAQFEAVISRYTVEQIPSNLTIEARTAGEKQNMNALGVRYAGVIRVDDMHAYAKQ